MLGDLRTTPTRIIADISVGKGFQDGCQRLTTFVSSTVQIDEVFGTYFFSQFLPRRFDGHVAILCPLLYPYMYQCAVLTCVFRVVNVSAVIHEYSQEPERTVVGRGI